MVDAALCPGAGIVVSQQQHVVVLGLDLVQVQRDPAVGVGVACRAVGQARLTHVEVQAGRVDHAHAAQALQLLGQLFTERAGVNALGDRYQCHAHGARHARA